MTNEPERGAYFQPEVSLNRKRGQAHHGKFTYPHLADFPIFWRGNAGYADHTPIIEAVTVPQPRKRLVSTEVTPFYHVIARCVRRHFLCGVDPLTGKDYSARKQDIKDRLALLADSKKNDSTSENFRNWIARQSAVR